MKRYIWVLFLILLFSACHKKIETPVEGSRDKNESNTTQLLNEVIPTVDLFDWQQNDELLKQGKATKMVVKKSKRVLVLLDKEGDLLSRHRVSLGENPIGPKLREGDKKTPEGIYSIVDIRSDKKYYKEILISYPNAEDIKRSHVLGFNPGGGITFHAQVPWNWDGRGDDHTLANDWTNGCIALTNRGMDMVLEMIDKATIVEILE